MVLWAVFNDDDDDDDSIAGFLVVVSDVVIVILCAMFFFMNNEFQNGHQDTQYKYMMMTTPIHSYNNNVFGHVIPSKNQKTPSSSPLYHQQSELVVEIKLKC